MDEPVQPVAKRKKINETEKVLEQIKKKELELVEWHGKSAAWKKFQKLRNKATNTFIDFVQCKECKVLRVYSRKNGTTTLNNHKCNNGDENGSPMFKEASPEVAAELKTIFTKKLIQFCAEDVVPVALVEGSGFIHFVQYLWSVGEKYGNIDVRKIFPSSPAIHHAIENSRNKHNLRIGEILQQSVVKNLVSLSMNAWQIGVNEEQFLLVTNAAYFSEDLTSIGKNLLFTLPVQGSNSLDKLIGEIRKLLNKLGCDETKQNEMCIVTPGKELFYKILQSHSKRETCMAFTINSILKTSIRYSGNEIEEILFNCNEIVRFVIETQKNNKLKSAVVKDVGTWKSKINMINSLTCQYTDIINLLNAEGKPELKFNKSRAEELVQFLQAFVDAIEDLKSTTHATINKILPWYCILLDHLDSTDNYSIEMKLFMHQAKSAFTTQLVPSMNQKVACFLDPRYRRLKMLSEKERTEVIEEIRFHLENMPTEEVELPKTNEQEADNSLQKKKSRFSRFEVDDEDVGEIDEINVYLHSIQLKEYNFNDEFNIIGEFWKKNQQKLPKLFKLATTRLHVPACCCGGKDSLQRKIIPVDEFADLILMRDASVNK